MHAIGARNVHEMFNSLILKVRNHWVNGGDRQGDALSMADIDDMLLHLKTSKMNCGTYERVTKRVSNRKLKTGSSLNPSKLEDGIYSLDMQQPTINLLQA